MDSDFKPMNSAIQQLNHYWISTRCGSRGNGDRFSFLFFFPITEGAKAPPSNEGGQVQGHATLEKRFGF